MTPIKKSLQSTTALLVVTILTACGGGGGSSGTDIDRKTAFLTADRSIWIASMQGAGQPTATRAATDVIEPFHRANARLLNDFSRDTATGAIFPGSPRTAIALTDFGAIEIELSSGVVNLLMDVPVCRVTGFLYDFQNYDSSVVTFDGSGGACSVTENSTVRAVLLGQPGSGVPLSGCDQIAIPLYSDSGNLVSLVCVAVEANRVRVRRFSGDLTQASDVQNFDRQLGSFRPITTYHAISPLVRLLAFHDEDSETDHFVIYDENTQSITPLLENSGVNRPQQVAARVNDLVEDDGENLYIASGSSVFVFQIADLNAEPRVIRLPEEGTILELKYIEARLFALQVNSSGVSILSADSDGDFFGNIEAEIDGSLVSQERLGATAFAFQVESDGQRSAVLFSTVDSRLSMFPGASWAGIVRQSPGDFATNLLVKSGSSGLLVPQLQERYLLLAGITSVSQQIADVIPSSGGFRNSIPLPIGASVAIAEPFGSVTAIVTKGENDAIYWLDTDGFSLQRVDLDSVGLMSPELTLPFTHLQPFTDG